MSQRCSILPADPETSLSLQRELGLHSVTARCLVNRGVNTKSHAQAFLEPRLSGLRPPVGLAGLPEALERLVRAAQSGEKVGVFGDYDVDGVTTAALLTTALRSFGCEVVPRVANRQAGYGFSLEAAQAFVAEECSLVITGDCGTSDLPSIEAVNASGAQVIVIDHHTVPERSEEHPALALINPFRSDSDFPFQGMASVGLAFYVMGALRTELRKLGHFRKAEPDVCAWLDLVAMGTVADLVPLHDENRIMTTEGLRRLAKRERPGVAALLQVAGVRPSEVIDERTIGWKLGPRINAPGRLGDAQVALDLLLAPDKYKADALARVIETINSERRAEQERVFAEAIEKIGDVIPEHALVVSGKGWAHGVVGIIASRLVDRFGCPTVVIAIDEATGEARGSGRSIPGVQLYNALDAASEHVIRFGGHAAAAGVSLRESAIEAFTESFVAAVAEQEAEAVNLQCDAEVPASEVSDRLAQELGSLAPFGKGNEEPLLMSRGVEVRETRRVGDGSHLKLTLADEGGRELSAIAFGMGEQDPGAGARIDLAYVPAITQWAGQSRLELSVRQLWPSEG